ncbi:type I secretion system permease/ATPase [Novosphingobium sp.]|uniref:type I secretion system permease/ATPase n=1 Tax=Novosphingobium sp. TaxID=1874826 RepID=UPI00260FF237|nr:type I secretion system permease/ATPase [Novosphingobium sp.]
MTGVERLSIREVWSRYRRYGLVVIIASVLLNLIAFAGSLYMMLVYDSVLPSSNIGTLAGLFGILLVLYAFQGLFEGIRSDAVLAIANGLHDDLYEPVHYATSRVAIGGGGKGNDGMQLVRDLDQIHAFLTSPGPIAFIDLPWVVLFMTVLAALHWALGLTALLGTVILLGLAAHMARRTTQGSADLSAIMSGRAAATLQEIRFAETAQAMGMRSRLTARSTGFESRYIAAQAYLSRTTLRLGSTGRIFRMLLQSAMLTVGALLVIKGSASGGVIIASSILSGRALAPVDIAIANWRAFVGARAGWTRILQAMERFSRPAPRQVNLGAPGGNIVVQDLWLVPPGGTAAVVSDVSFELVPGQVLAVVGPSAAGKTSLAKALAGIWPPARGEIRVGGATYGQWDPDVFGRSIGYLPQAVDLLEGTVGENISRFDPDARSEDIIAAASAAGLHELILKLSNGYDTMVGPASGELSAGQRQRIGLARALFGNPFLLVLDEPNSNLDADGDMALSAAITAVKSRGGIAVMITHRPATLGPATHVAVMADGRLARFGQRDEVLRALAAGPVRRNRDGAADMVAVRRG